METESFLKHVITTPSGWFNLAFKPASDDEWTSEWYEWPNQMHDIVGHATQLASKNNVYFSAHLFNAKKALKANVLPSRTIQADLDNALIPTVNQPTVLVETSPQRHQGFWILEAAPTPQELETLSRSLTYDIIDSDHSGWSLGHKMRVPNTYNFKYATGPKQVRVISAILNTYKTLKFNTADIELQEHIDDEVDIDIATFKPPSEGPRQLWAKYRSKVPRAVSNKYDIAQPDRSAAIWGLELALFRVGLSRDEVFWICRESANNKFRDNKYHADLDLWKDVLRAERNLRTPVQDEDIKLRINEARRLPGLASDRRLYIAGIVRDHMMQNGSFVATTDNQEWYVREDNGRPINLGFHNEFMASLLEIRYGLSAVETEQRYTIGNLRTMTRERGQHGEVGVLSHFDRKNRALLVHQGRKDVAYVTETSVSTINNGNLGVVFPWISDQAPFDPTPTDPSFLDNLFQGCFDNLEDLAPKHALALLKAWLMFLIFRGDARSRPLLVFLGQPGSGKTTLFNRIYAMLYGPDKHITKVSTAENYDHAVSHDPFVVFDDVDGYYPWLPDSLALSAGNNDLKRRKLYTDNDEITLKLQALVGITAHNPKFLREDVVDRMIILNFHRLEAHHSETPIIDRVIRERDKLWGSLLNGAQAMLQTPMPLETEVPVFRVNDFARIGLWAARSLGFEKDFREALAGNKEEQVALNLSEEGMLIDTLNRWLARPKPAWYNPAELWEDLILVTSDETNFRRLYKNSVVLGKKLMTLEDTLRSMFKVEIEATEIGIHKWRLSKK